MRGIAEIVCVHLRNWKATWDNSKKAPQNSGGHHRNLLHTRRENTGAANFCNKSAIADRVPHWEWSDGRGKCKDHGSRITGRLITEAVWIRKSNTMNQDEGNYQRHARLIELRDSTITTTFYLPTSETGSQSWWWWRRRGIYFPQIEQYNFDLHKYFLIVQGCQKGHRPSVLVTHDNLTVVSCK